MFLIACSLSYLIIMIIITNLFYVDIKILIFYNKKLYQDSKCALCTVTS